MNARAKKQLINIINSGKTDMFNINKVRSRALYNHFDELYQFLGDKNNHIEYANFILFNEEKPSINKDER